jgi:transcriptional regulator with XRE-family HTH domain
MSVISERFADELAAEKAMREAYLSAQTRTKLSNQIRAIRNQRGWSQAEFAKALNKPPSNVSRIENREYGHFTLTTLFELANTFDCGLVVEFVPYEEFLRRTHDLTPNNLKVPQYNRAALQPLVQDLAAPENLWPANWLPLFGNAEMTGLGLGYQGLWLGGFPAGIAQSGNVLSGSLQPLPDISQLRQENSDLRAENARLREENAKLGSDADVEPPPFLFDETGVAVTIPLPPAYMIDASLGWTGP